MRIEPSEKALQAKEVVPLKIKVQRITRIIALIVAFLSTFIFFFKILFF